MESPAKSSRGEPSQSRDTSDAGSKARKRSAVSALQVSDVVRYGRGARSRIDFTIGCSGRRVRLRLPARDVLSYGRIGKAAMQEGMVLPYERSANRAWRKVLARAMERARAEPLLEGEEIAEALSEEIQVLLEGGPRGESAFDLMAGKVVELGDRLLVSPKSLVLAVRKRLLDDVLSQATIAEAAAAHLGMRELRHRFPDARPRAWAFPQRAGTRENREAVEFRRVEDVSSKPGEEKETRPGRANEASVRWEQSGPVHGPNGKTHISPDY